MTYLAFLFYFLIPPITLLLGWALVKGDGGVLRASIRPVGFVALIALMYTAPWDNYLIHREVWWYGADRVRGTIGLVPVEEYAFMVLQSTMTGMFTILVYGYRALPDVGRGSRRGWIGGALWMAVAIAGWVMIACDGKTLYMGLILGWSAPVMAGLWWLGAPRYRAWPQRYLLSISIPSAYLWIADALAIDAGIWRISESYTVGLDFGPMPLEEIMFFLVTNVLIVTGVLLIAGREESMNA